MVYGSLRVPDQLTSHLALTPKDTGSHPFRLSWREGGNVSNHSGPSLPHAVGWADLEHGMPETASVNPALDLSFNEPTIGLEPKNAEFVGQHIRAESGVTRRCPLVPPFFLAQIGPASAV